MGDIGLEQVAETDNSIDNWEQNCESFLRLIRDWRTSDRRFLRSLRRPRSFPLHSDVMNKVIAQQVGQIEGISNLDECDRRNYSSCLKLLLEAEEIHQAIEMQRLNREGQILAATWRYHPSMYGFELHNMNDITPSIVGGDYVFIEFQSGYLLVIQIEAINDNLIVLPRGATKVFGRELASPKRVSFLPLGAPFNYFQLAVKKLSKKETVQCLLFEEVGSPTSFNENKIDVINTNNEYLERRLRQLNAHQRETVMGILDAKCRPKPYIVFGPPGTGKTSTVVEAVVQIYHRSKKVESKQHHKFDTFCRSNMYYDSRQNFRILVCANSNSCTDQLFKQISRELPNDAKVVRLYSSRVKIEVDWTTDPEIVVTTNTRSGHILRSRDLNLQFDYIFLDEAGHANVAESLVPACLLKSDGCLVLAGDPKQLGPVVQCKEVKKLGLSKSFLSRLVEYDIYQANLVTQEYDRRYMTMLNVCYRCDERNMVTNNRLFYMNRLKFNTYTKCPKGLLKILRLTSPLQMRHVNGVNSRLPGSYSLYNAAEMNVCVDLVKRLYCLGIELSKIGVACLYKSQALMVKKAIRSVEDDVLLSRMITKRFANSKPQYMTLDEAPRFIEELTREALSDYKLPPGWKFYKKTDGDLYEEWDAERSALCSNAWWYVEPDKIDLYVGREGCKVDTVDAFQGDEREIMIISTVRTKGQGKSLDFISEPRRFNVAISRAKWLVIVVGHSKVLRRADHWKELLQETKSETTAWPKWKTLNLNRPFEQSPLFYKARQS